MNRSKEIIKVSIIGIIVNIVLVILKAIIGFISGSIAIILDAINNLSDALSSIITILGSKLANKDPDKKHPYGYGQIEYVSSITIAVIILATGLTSFKESFDKILYPSSVNYTTVTLLIVIIGILTKYFLGRYVKGKGKELNSESLIASGTDAIFDSIVSLSTLVAALVYIFLHINIEGYVGLIISVLILKAGIEILMDSLNRIIGSRVDSELSTNLKSRIASYPNVLGAYDLVLHRYGPKKMIGSVHIEVNDDMKASEIHALTRTITEDVYLNYGIVLTVGIYASNTENKKYADMKNYLKELVKEYKDIIQMHGFYVDTLRKLISFDLIIDFKSEIKQEIREEIIDKMKKKYPEYNYVVVLDNDFSD